MPTHRKNKSFRVDDQDRTETLFALSRFNKQPKNSNRVRLVRDVLDNPMCQAIFDARMRGFSDVITPSEPITQEFADTLIEKLCLEKNEEVRISIFFDALSTHRPFPNSQKHVNEMAISDAVSDALTLYCQDLIQKAHNLRKCHDAKRTITQLITTGGDQRVFDEIKYVTAQKIVSTDLSSTLKYHALMAAIKTELFKPRTELNAFNEELKQLTRKWSDEDINQTNLTMSECAATKTSSLFTAKDFSYLAQNEHTRYAVNSKKVAHALIVPGPDGTKEALQYRLPEPQNLSTPESYQLQHIEQITRLGSIRYRARGQDGKTWYANRTLQIDFKDEDEETIHGEIAYFSEEESPEKEPSWDNQQRLPRFRAGQVSGPNKKKGGYDLEVEPNSVFARDQDKGRGINQNQVMGQSARDAYEERFDHMEKQLSPEIIPILRRAFLADTSKAAEKNQYRPEWLHAYGFSLTPLDQNPQRADNLGAAGKWVNTEMMILERVAKWFALNEKKDINIKINALFEMLGDSELIDTVQFAVSIEFKKRFIQLRQELDALKESPVFRKASDLAQTTGISHSLLHTIPPLSREKVITDSTQRPTMTSPWRLVPEVITPQTSSTSSTFIVSIIDLETTGLNVSQDKIIEIGVLSFSCTMRDGILDLVDQYDAFNDPGQDLSIEVIQLTDITNEQLRGSVIDWQRVLLMLERSDYVVCHNAEFDRKFLERDTPEDVQQKIKTMKFGCTRADIDWKARGYWQEKLSYLNAQLSFYHKGHRAINDCWATLNLLKEFEGALVELLSNIEKNNALLCATGATFDKKDLLKNKKFYWSDGTGNIPKCWYIYVRQDDFEAMKQWLDQHIYNGKPRSGQIPQRQNISAVDKYSIRAELLPMTTTKSLPFFHNTQKKKRKRTESELNDEADLGVNCEAKRF